ncbi:MAG: AcrR family transcriptional regulator [Pontimonas sp.]|jgi:AcrR family transcriptional regulator
MSATSTSPDVARPRPRGRPRLVEEKDALDRLTQIFWTQGYTQTSLHDLEVASGMHKPSLYRLFGSKEELFARVLRRYLDRRMTMFARLIELSGPGVAGIHSFLSSLRDDIVQGSSKNGCLLVASSTELHGSTPGFDDFGVVYREQLRERMGVLIALAGGESQVVESRTDLFTTWLLGVDVATRGGANEAEIDRTVGAMRMVVDTWVR